MFYSWQILAKGGPLQVAWLAAHTDPKKLERQKVVAASIPATIESILHPQDPAGSLAKGQKSKSFAASHAAAAHGGLLRGSSDGTGGAEAAPLALRLSGQLLLGVVRVYNKKASLLEGDLCETLERLQREVSAPLEPLAKVTRWPAALGKSKAVAGRSSGHGAEDARERERRVPGRVAEGSKAGVVSEGGVRGGAWWKSKDDLGKRRDAEDVGEGGGRSRRAVYHEEGVELQEWMAELAAVEEEEVFLRRSSGQFGDGGGSGVSQSMLMPGHLSQEGNIQAVNPLSSHLHHHHHHHLQQQQQQQQPAWVRGSASLGGSKGFVQGQSGLQSPIVGSQEVAAAGCVQGHGGGPGLEAGEDEVFECGGEECEYDLNRLDLSGHEAALLTQPSAAPTAFTDERLKPQANSHSLAGCCEDAAAGKLTGAPVVDKEGSRGHSEERRDCSDRMLDAGSMEEAEFMMEGAECGDMPALQQLPSALHHGEATPRNAIFGRHHEILDDGATVPADSQQLEHPGSDGMRGRDPASTKAYKAGRDHLYEATAAGRSSGEMDRNQPGSNPECLPSQEGQHTAAEGGSRSGRRLSSARCLLPLFTSLQSTNIMEQKRQQQQQQQQRSARVPPPEHCPHSRLGLRRGRVEHSSAGVGGYKVKGRGKVVNTIELSTSTIKQTLKDSRPLLDQTRQACCTLRTAFLQPKVPNNLPYLPLGAASDIPPLLLPPPSYYASPTVNVSAKGAHRPSMPPGVSAVPELAFILHESGLCSPSHLSPELQCLFFEALGWGAQPVGQQQQRHGHVQQQQQQQQQRNERARCRNQAECSKRTEGPVNQRDGPSRGTAQSREAAKNERWVESGGGGGGQAVLEVEQGEGLQGGDSQELGAQGDQVLQGQEQGFEGQQEQEQSHQEQLCYQQQHADEQDEEESEREGGNLCGTKLWHGLRSGTGVGSQGVLDGFTARTYKLLLHLQQLFLGEGGSKAEEGGTLGSPTKKRRTQQAQKDRGRLHEVSVVRELLAEQLQAAAKASAPCKIGKARTERRPSAGTSACQASAHRICAARTFHDMLVLQTGGYVRLQQTESFGDLRVREGHKLERCTSDLSLPGPGMGELPISLESL